MKNFKVLKKFICSAITLIFMFNTIKTTSFADKAAIVLPSLANIMYDNLLQNNSYHLGGRERQLWQELRRFKLNHQFYDYDDFYYEYEKYTVYNLIPRKIMADFIWQLPYSEEYTDEFKEILLHEMPAIIMTEKDAKKIKFDWHYGLTYKDLHKTLEEERLQNRIHLEKQYQRLVEQGDFKGVLIDEVDTIGKNFPGKYDEALDEVCEYIELLNFRTENGIVKFTNPLDKSQTLEYRPHYLRSR